MSKTAMCSCLAQEQRFDNLKLLTILVRAMGYSSSPLFAAGPGAPPLRRLSVLPQVWETTNLI